ncbi:microtubule-associated protein futsch [Bradysia coprophila]|uniref:microtubule-associated protein futsch n=1 Tax=Bradysia coprophila TaxID=38358 RepID=UPI00187DCE09|nr:microtubule-associated protein futsch [Bradysia coprophila]XP_037050122.1 microtubule-associated protein futsch [Bradysia coprophila]
MGDPSGGPIEENGGQNGDNTEPSSLVGMGPPSPLTGSYLLIIIGEPHSAEHKDIILQRLVKGLLSWDSVQTHVDLEDELNTITVHAPEGEDARHGERLIQYASENLVTEILIHPQYNTLIQCMRNLLSSFTRHRHIIHAGYTFSGNGSWILQDGTFSVSDFAEAFQEHDVQRVLRAYPDTVSMDIHCDSSAGLWNVLPDKNYAKTCKIRINPVDVLESGSDRIKAFIDYLAPMLNPANLNDLLESSDVVGNIRFSHPTLYVFPGGQGDAALFGINGFNMLVDGGFNRKACFWNFARHLDRLDAVLMTRINNSNIQGIGSVIERKASSHVYPGIGHFFCNIPERRAISSPEENKDKDSLVIDLFDKGQKLVSNLKSISLKPQMCYRDVEPMNLYHKVGHGTLDMYVISPGKDSREVKEFMQKWTTNDQKLFTAKDTKDFQFPLQNLVSICALLVWQPANPEETITRILFPGSTPDYKIMEGLEKIKHLEFMKYPMCTAKKLVPSISTATITKKVLKSAINEKSIPEPILPSKTTKSEKDNQVIDNKVKTNQDNRAKESKLIEEQTADKKAPIKARPKKVIPKKTDSLDEKQKDDVIENKEKDDETIDKPQVVINGTDITETEQKDETDVTAKPKKIEPKSKTDTKVTVKSRIDSRPPKSMDKKVVKRDASEKKEVGKQSPTTTPKKTSSDPKLANGVPKEKEVKPRIVSRVTKSSPSSTPAKSTKEANNRKVLESKQKAKTVKREVVKTIEKKEEKVERKPISHRTKGISPSRRPPDSPKKSIKPKTEKDNIIRKAKLDKGGTTDSSLVSTPSADDTLAKKLVDVAIVDDVAKQRELDELKEEQEAVREIEEVFKREEKSKKKDVSADHREVAIQDSATEAEDDEEYLIIEKEEVEQYTEDSINEQESSMAKEEEMQKHQRDSQESEKKRKSSLQTTEEEIEPKDGTEGEANAAEEDGDQVEVVEQDKDGDDVQPDSIEDAAAVNKLEPAEEEHIKEEVQEIITSAKEIAKIKSESKEEVAKTEEMSSPTPEEKLSSTKKTSDTKDDLVQPAKDGEAPNLPESQPFSTTIESGATTAPTLPEDERIPLDEIKEDLVVEEKYIKEETKEAKEPEAPVSTVLQKTYEPLERAVPSKMHFDTTQPHLRDIVKTPDEVADLPVHEEADIETYEGSEEAKDDKKAATEKKPSETTKEGETEVVGTAEVDHKMKIPNGSVVNKVENEKLEQDLIEEEKNKEEHAAEEKEEDQASKPEDDKPIFDKKPEITGFKEKDSTMAKKVEYAVEDLGKNFETKLKDVTQKEDKSQSEKVKEIVAKDSDIQQQADETTETDVQVGKEDEKQSQDGAAEEPESLPKDDIKDFVDRAVSGVSSFIESTSKAITDKVESLVESAIIGGETETESKEIAVDKEEFKEVFDYSHPYGLKTFPTELRETHITTLDSPVAEKDKIIDLKILDKLPEAIDEDHDEIIAKSMVPPFHPDDFKYASFERDDSNLKDIKEEEEEDRSTPPSNEQIASRKESTEISDLTNKDTITVVGLDEQPPRAVSPREEEVLKIVANVAEVLKSEKDIAEIIPDFSEEELERKLRGASPRLDDENATVQRMLVTTSSEDGGEEIEICPEGTIKFSPACTTPDVLSGKATPDIPKDVADVKSERDGKEGLEINLEKQVEKDEKQTSDPSTPEAKTSSISIDEKEKHEIPEKAQVDAKTEKVPEIVADKSIDESTSRKESVVSDFIDDVSDRRESAFSEKDFTKDESSIDGSRPPSSISNNLKVEKDEDEVTIKTDIVVDQSSEMKSVVGKEEKPKGDEKSPTLSDLKVEVSDERRESAASHVSDKSGIEISRPDSIISHFSDRSEPELKEKLGSSPDSITSLDKAMAFMKSTDSNLPSTGTEKLSVSRPESAASHTSDADKTEELDTVRGSSVTSPKSESVEEASKKSVIQTSKSKTHEDDVTSENQKEKESRPLSAVSHVSDDAKNAKPETTSSSPAISKEEGSSSKPPSVADDKLDVNDGTSIPPSSASCVSDKEDKKIAEHSRPASVASSKGAEDEPKDQIDILGEKENVSRPASAIDDKNVHKESRPESVASSKGEQEAVKDKTTDDQEEESRPASDNKEIQKDSRPESVTSSKDGQVTPKGISGDKESRPVSAAEHKGSRPESVASSKDLIGASKDEISAESRPSSIVGDKDEHKDSRPASATSLKDGQATPKDQTDISSDKESRPPSAVVDQEVHKDSRPQSVTSSKDGQETPKDISGDKESRPTSAVEKEDHKDSRPESVASSKDEKEKESRPPSAVVDQEVHKDSRPQSVTSSKDGQATPKDVSSEKESRPTSAVDKEEPKDSRPESVASSKDETRAPKEEVSAEKENESRPPSAVVDEEVHKDSSPESVASSKDGQATPKDVSGDKESRPTSAVDREAPKDSRPESVASSKDGKEKESRPPSAVVDEEVHKDSRHESAASSKDGLATPKDVSGDKESRPTSAVEKEAPKDSRPESAASSKDEIGALKEEVSAEKDEHKDSRPESVSSSKDGQAAPKDQTDISSEKEKESRPPSAVGDKGEHKDSRPESVASSKEGQATPKDQTDISSEKGKESRPPSTVGDKDEQKGSRPESAASSKEGQATPKDQTDISTEKELDISGEKGKESRPVSALDDEEIQKDSRPESVASSKGEREVLKEKPDERKESRPPSAIDNIEIQKDSRPESVASSKDGQVAPNEQTDVSGEKQQESRPPSAVDKEHKVSRPESVASSKEEKAAPKEETSTEKEKESRPPSAVGDKDSHKDSRPESVASSKDEILVTKSTVSPQPINVSSDSRPLSAASNASEKDITAVAEASRPDSVMTSKSNEIQKESRPQSAASHTSDKEQSQHESVTCLKTTYEKVESVVEVKSEHMVKEVITDKNVKDTRSPSIASSVGGEKEKDASRSPSVTSRDSDKQEIKEQTIDSRPLSAASTKDEKESARPESVLSDKLAPENISRPASVASSVGDNEENKVTKDTAHDSRASSRASFRDDKEQTRPQSAVSEKSIDRQKTDSRPPSVASFTSDKIEAKEADNVSDKAVELDLRPPSATSCKSDKETTCAESDDKVKDSRSASGISSTDVKDVKLPKEKDDSRPPSTASHVSQLSDKPGNTEAKETSRPASVASSKDNKDAARPESVLSDKLEQEEVKTSRPPSSASHISDKVELKETKESSRPASVASSKDNKDVTRPESVLSDKLEHEEVKISRPPSSASHISDKVELKETKESSRPASVASSKDNKDVTRPESVLSDKLEQEEVKTSRPPSSASHISDKVDFKETKESSRPASVASSKDEKDVTRPESVLSEKLEQEQVKGSRPPSSASHISDKAVSNEAKESSRPSSVASSKEQKVATPPESVSGKDSRPPSAASHVSDKVEVKEIDQDSRPASKASVEDGKDTLSEKSKPEHEQVKDSRPPSAASDGKQIDGTRSPSVASHASDKIETKQSEEEKDSRSPSVVSHISDKPEVHEVKPDSRSPSSASSVKDGKSTRPESAGSDKSIKEEKSDSRPLSAQSNVTENAEVKLEETTKESRSQSIASRISDTVEIEEKVDKVEITELQKSSRPSSVVSHVSEKEEVEKESAKDSPELPIAAKDSRSGSAVSQGPEDISRPESGLSGKDGKSKDSRPPSVNLSDKIEKDTKDEELSRPHSQSSSAPEEPKESSTADSGVHRSNSVVSHQSDALNKDSRPTSSLSHDENAKEVKISRPGSAASNISNKEVVSSNDNDSAAVQPEKQSRPQSSTSSKHGDDFPRPDSVASGVGDDAHRPLSVSSHRSEDEQQISRPASAASNESDIENSQKIVEDLTKAIDRKPSQSEQLPADLVQKPKDSRSASVVSTMSDAHDKDIHLSRPGSVASHVSEKDSNQRPGSATSQLSESRSPSRRESAVERCSVDDVEMEVKVKDARSKSVSSIMITSMYKPDGFEPMATFEEHGEQTKDDSMIGSTSRKASDITDLIDDVKKIDAKLTSSSVVECKVESSSSASPETELSDKISTETILSGKSSPSESKSNVKPSESMPCSSLDAPKSGAESLSGKSTPDVADIEKKILEETTTHQSQTSKQTDATEDHDFDHISITEKVSKTIEVTTAVLTEIQSTSKSSESHTTTTTSSSETQSESVIKDGAVNKDVVTTIKTEFRSYTPSSDDFDIHETNSPRSDVSAGHIARVVCGWTGSDDDITNSPLSTTSQAPCSPPSKFTYETEYELQRSSSGVSKKSEFDIDDSQDDVPPEYGSEEVASAIPIPLSAYKTDPMKTSVYGKLPESEPIPITTTIRTVITKQYDEYASSGPDSSSCVSQESARSSSDHRFLDEADLDFEKALEEHRQVRGSDVMSSVTSKYEFSPSKEPLESGKSAEFPLSGVQKGKSFDAKPDQPSTSEVQTKTEEEILKEEVEARVLSWGKPLGLPSPLPVENQTTPKRERKLMISKTKMNNEKNLRKRSESPIKGKKVTPIYMDLTYVPHNGNSYYSHVEFFKRIRARYYVFSGTEPSRDVYNALLEAKQTWEDKELEVTIIPTYDTDVLGYWVSENEDLLAKYRIDLSPSASRCTINLQDHETSCSAYRLEF